MTNTPSNRSARLEARLRDALAPIELEVLDDSHLHAGHAGAADGRGHFTVNILSERFTGVPVVRRHRIVYEAVGDKEALLLAVAEELSDELIAAIEEHFDAPEQAELPLADLVRDDLTWFMGQIRADPALVPITRLGTLLAAHGADPATRIRRRIEDRLTKLHIDRAREFGLADRGESARVVASLVIALAEAMAFRLDLDQDWPVDAAIAIAVEFAVGGYVNVEGAGRGAITAFDEMTGD